MTLAALPNRFLKKINFGDNCWLWTATKNKDGYGKYKVNGKMVYAHRFSYFLFNGVLPRDLLVCHKCDTPACVNPDHLFIGTRKDNSEDMVAKDRQSRATRIGPSSENHFYKRHPELVLRGEQSSRSKLTQFQVDEIRRTYKRGAPGVPSEFSFRGLASKYGVSARQICSIVHELSWNPNLSTTRGENQHEHHIND